jgi:hypothetical protein
MLCGQRLELPERCYFGMTYGGAIDGSADHPDSDSVTAHIR